MRGVSVDPNVADELYEVYGGAELADVAIDAIMWTLGRDPTQGQEVGYGFWMIEHAGGGIWKHVQFYYSFDDKEVWIQGIRH